MYSNMWVLHIGHTSDLHTLTYEVTYNTHTHEHTRTGLPRGCLERTRTVGREELKEQDTITPTRVLVGL